MKKTTDKTAPTVPVSLKAVFAFSLLFSLFESVLFSWFDTDAKLDLTTLLWSFALNTLLNYTFLFCFHFLLNIPFLLLRRISKILLSAFVGFSLISWVLFLRLKIFLDVSTWHFVKENFSNVLGHLNAADRREILLTFLLAAVAILAVLKLLEALQGMSSQKKKRPLEYALYNLIILSALWCLFAVNSKQAFYPVTPQTQIVLDAFKSDLFVPKNSDLRVIYEEIKEERPLDIHSIKKENLHPVIVLVIESLALDLNEMKSVMPNLHALAMDATVFDRNFTTSTHSSYADTSILSSQYALRYIKDTSYHIEHNKKFIYDVLKQLGYQSAYVSAQDESWSRMGDFIKTDALDVFVDAKGFDSIKNRDTNAFHAWTQMIGSAGKADDADVVKRGIGFIEENQQQSFFLAMNLQRTHFPYTWPEHFSAPFAPYEMDFRAVFGNYPVEYVPVMKNRYFNSLNYIDTQIGRLIDFLKAKDIYDQTIFVVTGDTGQGFYEHDVCCHGTGAYNEIVQTPLIMKFPNQNLLDKSHFTVSHIDIVPTVLGAMDIPVHPAFQGRNLFETQTDDAPLFIVSHTPRFNGMAMVDDGYKFIIDRSRNKEYLFNLREDPMEEKNLLLQESALSRSMRRQVLNWYAAQIEYYHNPDLYLKYYPPKYF